MEDIKDKEPTKSVVNIDDKTAGLNSLKEPCKSSDNSENRKSTEEHLNVTGDDGDEEETELRRSKRAKNTRL